MQNHDNVCNSYQGNSIPRVTKCYRLLSYVLRKITLTNLKKFPNYVP